jgi:uncharacterized protein
MIASAENIATPFIEDCLFFVNPFPGNMMHAIVSAAYLMLSLSRESVPTEPAGEFKGIRSMLHDVLALKYENLVGCLQSFASLGVAFSGGVDSTLLLAVARDVLKDKVTAFTARSPIHDENEIAHAFETARAMQVAHIVFHGTELDDPDFVANNSRRCYFCKKHLFATMRATAAAMGIHTMAHGANVDDHDDHRPGSQAAEEMDIEAPLIEAGFTKADVRNLARHLGLDVWNRPAMACLATRIPYGTEIRLDSLQQIRSAEAVLGRLGISQCRVRHHGNLARIEVAGQDLDRIAGEAVRNEIVSALRSLGYDFVCLDLEGYISGKMNREIGK